jgi:hypothetical protein
MQYLGLWIDTTNATMRPDHECLQHLCMLLTLVPETTQQNLWGDGVANVRRHKPAPARHLLVATAGPATQPQLAQTTDYGHRGNPPCSTQTLHPTHWPP